jgi:membrane protein DedA with SNARE-associated domain
LASTSYSLGLLLGGRRVLSLLLRGLLAPSLVGLFAYAVMLVLPRGEGLAAAFLVSVLGAFAGAFAAGVCGVIQREDLPKRLQRFWVFR